MQLTTRALNKIFHCVSAWAGRRHMRRSGVQMGKGIVLWGCPIVSRAAGSTIQIGDRVVLCSRSPMTALGVSHPVILRTMSQGARIVIGNDVGMSGGTICAAQSVTIGEGALLGANVTIADTDFHPTASTARRYSRKDVAIAPIQIEENVFVGTGCFVLKGVTIGANSIIGAGSVVTKSIPANVIAAGNPCRPVKHIDLIEETDQ